MRRKLYTPVPLFLLPLPGLCLAFYESLPIPVPVSILAPIPSCFGQRTAMGPRCYQLQLLLCLSGSALHWVAKVALDGALNCIKMRNAHTHITPSLLLPPSHMRDLECSQAAAEP